MSTSTLTRIGLWGAPLLAAAHIAWFYGALPERVASHFGPTGAADGWMSRSAFAMSYVGLVVGMAALFGGTGWWLRRFPTSMINLPHREFWLAPERREETLAALGRLMSGIGLATVGFLGVVFHLCLKANLDGTFRLGSGIFVALALYLGLLGAWIVLLLLRFGRPPTPATGH